MSNLPIKAFKEEYKKTIPLKLSEIEELILTINESKDKLPQLRLKVHKIAGSAGTYGYMEVSVLCKQFEQVLVDKFENRESLLDSNFISECHDFLKQLKEDFLK